MEWADLASDSSLHPALLNALALPATDRFAALRRLADTPRKSSKRVRSLPIFVEDAVDRLLKLIESASGDNRRAGAAGDTKHRENGERIRVVLTDGSTGEGPQMWCAWFVRRVLREIAIALFHSTPVLHAHGYVLRYRRLEKKQQPVDATALKFHTDDSDYTFNCCLGRYWTGGDLLFVDDDDARRPGSPIADEEEQKGTLWRYTHRVGCGVIHDDCYHAVEPLVSGERVQLVFWLLRDDEEWKREFFSSLERTLAEPAR